MGYRGSEPRRLGALLSTRRGGGTEGPLRLGKKKVKSLKPAVGRDPGEGMSGGGPLTLLTQLARKAGVTHTVCPLGG